VALEAMLNSKPLVVSNLGSMKDIVKEGYNGLLFEANNIEQLRKKIKILFDDDTICKKMGKNAYHEAITAYNPETHYKKLITVFERAIKENKK
jgi:glycosyltransferase involved in cell wall biosynthesis